MHKQIFEKFLGKKVKIVLRPNNFGLVGTIDAVFEDCIEFRTSQQSSFLAFDKVTSIREV